MHIFCAFRRLLQEGYIWHTIRMDSDTDRFLATKQKAHALYIAQRELWCPYFKIKIILNSDGFHHLRFSARRERNRQEQLLKFRLLPLALEVIRASGTIQEYRNALVPVGAPSSRTGAVSMKEVEYWGLRAIVGQKKLRIRVILRRVGNGNITFWSVMPDVKIKDGKQRLFDPDIGDV